MIGLGGAAFACWAATRLGLAGPPVNKRMWTPAFVLSDGGDQHRVAARLPMWSPMSTARQANPVLRIGGRVLTWPWAALGRNALGRLRRSARARRGTGADTGPRRHAADDCGGLPTGALRPWLVRVSTRSGPTSR